MTARQFPADFLFRRRSNFLTTLTMSKGWSGLGWAWSKVRRLRSRSGNGRGNASLGLTTTTCLGSRVSYGFRRFLTHGPTRCRWCLTRSGRKTSACWFFFGTFRGWFSSSTWCRFSLSSRCVGVRWRSACCESIGLRIRCGYGNFRRSFFRLPQYRLNGPET